MFDPYDDATLTKAPSGRWMLHGIELTCGSSFEVNIDNHWIRVRIEYESDGYFVVPISVRLHHGLWARFLGEYTD
jgi:hypothetical protein